MRKFSIMFLFIYPSNVILVSKKFCAPESFLSMLAEKADAEDNVIKVIL